MTEEYEFQRTSLHSAVGSDKILSETSTTRLILRHLVIENQQNPDAKVEIALVHQRKSPKGTWEDSPNVPLSSLKAGEQVKFSLHSEPTLKLYEQLRNLYTVATKGRIGSGKTKLIVGREEEIIQTDVDRAKVINLLLARGHSTEIWNELIRVDPGLATRLSYARIHAQRKSVLEIFKNMVEIKRPATQLLGNESYRNGAWELGEELTGGVSQMHANCSKWEKEGSKAEENQEALLQQGIFTVQPKGILVIGHTNQLSDSSRRATFEMFRRNTVNPEILTFDELYERAKFIVEHTGQGKAQPSASTDASNRPLT